jgi:iron complex transport system substrate-binding protein
MKQDILAFLTLSVIVGSVFSVACVGPSPPEEIIPSPPPPPTEEKPPAEVRPEPEELPSFPLTIVDDLGRTVEIIKLPQRIVSLAPSNTEILFALGLEDKIVGTTDYCDYPEAAKAKPRVAGYTTPDIEKLVSLEPDLILAEAIHEERLLPALEKLGLTVIVMSAKSIDTVLQDITLLGQINGKSKVAAQLVNDLTQRIEAVTSKTEGLSPKERLRVLYVCWHDPIWTMGSDTFINDLIWKAGGVNIFADDFEKSRVVSLEAVVSENPQVIIVSGMGTTGDLIYNNMKKETRLRGVEAIVNNRVYKISDANLIERPGPRIVDGLEEVAKLIHPEIFGALETEPE